MNSNNNTIKALITSAWTVLASAVAIIINSIVIVGMNGWQWDLFYTIYYSLWPVFLIILGVVFVLLLILNRFPMQTLFTGLLSVALLLALASAKTDEIAIAIRGYIEGLYELSYLVASVTILAFLLSAVALYRSRQKQEENC